MTRVYVDDTGKRLALGPELGRGGEGVVYDLRGTALAAKIYHRPAEPAKADKLEAMVRLRAPALSKFSAWPERRILDPTGRHTWGIVLPKVLGHHAIHELYSPADRKVEFPFADWTFLVHVARNCAAAFEAIHAAGHVVGDVNQGGVFVSKQGTITLIDCDSYQIADGARLFTCDVGVPHFTAPELQGQAFRGLHRTPEHDGFGLAVLVFHLLFMGRHPFVGRYVGAGDMPVERAIKEGRFAYGADAGRVQMTPPPHSLGLSQVPPEIAELFERAFRPPMGPTHRPSATDWLQALERLKRSIVACSQRRGHKFAAGGTNVCPWCDIVHAGGPDLFVSAQVLVRIAATPKASSFDLALFWREIEALPPPMPTQPRAPVSMPKPTPAIPRDELAWAWATVTIGVSAVLLGGVSLLMTTTVGTFTFQMFGALLASGWFVMRVKSPYAELRASVRTELQAAARDVQQAVVEWQLRTGALAQAFVEKREAIRGISFDYERHLDAFRREEADLVAHHRPAADRAALAGRRATTLASFEQALVAGLEELKQLQASGDQITAASDYRFQAAMERQQEAASAVTGLPFPVWAA
jgi:DNA-binding helix-hairpin-helix protein with protein kinase domain